MRPQLAPRSPAAARGEAATIISIPLAKTRKMRDAMVKYDRAFVSFARTELIVLEKGSSVTRLGLIAKVVLLLEPEQARIGATSGHQFSVTSLFLDTSIRQE